MWKDPIVEEVRAARAEMFKQAGGTLDGLTALLRNKRVARRAGKEVSYQPKKPVVPKRATDSLLSIANRVAAAGIPPMSMDEINAEVKAARAERKQRAGGR